MAGATRTQLGVCFRGEPCSESLLAGRCLFDPCLQGGSVDPDFGSGFEEALRVQNVTRFTCAHGMKDFCRQVGSLSFMGLGASGLEAFQVFGALAVEKWALPKKASLSLDAPHSIDLSTMLTCLQYRTLR